MAEKVTAFKANDGSLHDSECEAARRDLELLIAAPPCAENTPYARTLLQWMTDQAGEIIAVLRDYEDACPKPAEQAAESEAVSVCFHDNMVPQRTGHGPILLCRDCGHERPDESRVTHDDIPGVTSKAPLSQLKSHEQWCGSRASGFFRHCDCGFFTATQVNEYARLSNEAFGKGSEQ